MLCSPALMRLPPQQQRLFVAPELYGSGNSAAAGGGTDGAGAPSRPMPSGASAAAAAAAAAPTMSADRGVTTVAEEEDEEQDESEGQAQGHGQGTPAAAGPSPASDVYAFGGLLWAMAGGHTLLGAEELLDAPTGPGGGWRAGLQKVYVRTSVVAQGRYGGKGRWEAAVAPGVALLVWNPAVHHREVGLGSWVQRLTLRGRNGMSLKQRYTRCSRLRCEKQAM